MIGWSNTYNNPANELFTNKIQQTYLTKKII